MVAAFKALLTIPNAFWVIGGAAGFLQGCIKVDGTFA
jgi:hypothetical protein